MIDKLVNYKFFLGTAGKQIDRFAIVRCSVAIGCKNMAQQVCLFREREERFQHTVSAKLISICKDTGKCVINFCVAKIFDRISNFRCN